MIRIYHNHKLQTTLWSEIIFPSSKPFLLCTIYRPPNVPYDWIELFEAELSVAQTTGFEIILIGDFNINYLNCSSKKWLHLVELFDIKQMITTPRELLKVRALLLTIYTVQTHSISLTVSYPNTQLAIISLYVLQEKSTVRSKGHVI